MRQYEAAGDNKSAEYYRQSVLEVTKVSSQPALN